MADVFETFLGLSHGERVEYGKASAGAIIQYCKQEGLDDEQTLGFFCGLVKLFVSADRSCSRAEYDLFIDITGFDLDTDKFFEMTNGGANSDFVSAIFDVIHAMDSDAKDAVVVFGLCICSADRDVSYAEKQVLAKVYE